MFEYTFGASLGKTRASLQLSLRQEPADSSLIGLYTNHSAQQVHTQLILRVPNFFGKKKMQILITILLFFVVSDHSAQKSCLLLKFHIKLTNNVRSMQEEKL